MLGENTSSFIEQENHEDASFNSELLLQFFKMLWALYVDFVRLLANWQDKPSFPLTFEIPEMVGGKWWLEGIDAIIGNISWNSCNLPVNIYGLIQPQLVSTVLGSKGPACTLNNLLETSKYFQLGFKLSSKNNSGKHLCVLLNFLSNPVLGPGC